MQSIGDPHIVKRFDDELASLNQMMARMGGLAETQLSGALQAMLNGDVELATQVIEADEKTNGTESLVNEQVVRLLALRQPVADDLRIIMSALKVATALERVADHATSTAYRVRELTEMRSIPAVKTVGRLGTLVLGLLSQAVDAYMNRDADRAVALWRRDEEVDDLYSSLFRELLTYMMEDPRHISPCSQLMFIAKNLERVGDHATNIAEVTWFIVHGKPLNKERPKRDTSAYALVEPRTNG